uniref:Uncharacterized protein n=1 Tax=Oryza meridionalis TaxID=40149 RepID=A0A0E0DPU5_9ORYZ
MAKSRNAKPPRFKELCADKSNFQKEQTTSQKQRPVKVQSGAAEESMDPYSVRVLQRKLVYIVGMPSEFASDKANQVASRDVRKKRK